MKKRIAYILVSILVLAAAAGVGFGIMRKNAQTDVKDPIVNMEEDIDSATAMKKAVEYLKSIYKDVEKETPRDFQRIGVIPIGKLKFQVTWSVDVSEDYVKIVVNDDGMVTIDVNEDCGEEVKYVLTATITDADGNTKTLSWEHVIPKKVSGSYQEIVDKAYALKPGQSMSAPATLKGIISKINTEWSDQYKNITVTIIVEGRETKPIMCYRLKGEGAKDLAVGDIIEVTGTLKNYNGTIEFDAGCVLESVVKGDGKAPQLPTIKGTMQEIVDKAYALKENTVLEGGDAILTGSVTKIKTKYSEQYKNVTLTIVVDGREDKPIECYRLKGTNVEKVAVGDLITVRGTLKNYYGTVEFDAGCELIKWVKGGATYVPTAPAPIVPTAPAGELGTGDKVVIYAPAYSMALSTKKAGYYNAGVAVTMKDSVMSGYADTEIFTVTKNLDGTYSFSNGGQNIGLADEFTSMNLAAKHDKWELTDLGKGLYNLRNVGRDKYMEWSNQFDNWTTYGSDSVKTDDQFQLSFYIVSKGEVATEKHTLEEAKAELQKLYANAEKVTNSDYTRVARFELGASKYKVTWSVNVAEDVVKVTYMPDGTYQMKVTQSTEKDVDYVLTATIVDIDNESKSITATWEHVVEKAEVEVETNEKLANSYKLYLNQANLGKKLYFAGTPSGNYLATTEDKDASPDVYKETVEGGVRFYFMKDNAKQYIEIQQSGKYVNAKIAAEPTMVFTYDEDAKTYVADISGTKYYLGTYNTYNTISASKTSYITGSNAANVGVSQFVLQYEATPIAYKYFLQQATLDKTLYFAGSVNSTGFLETTDKADSAVDVYIEEVTDGVRFYFMNGNVKTYIEIFKNSASKIRHQLVTEPTMVYTYNSEAKTYVTEIDDTLYYTGTYSNYNTFSASKVSYITGSNAANVGVSQFVADFIEPNAIESEPEQPAPEPQPPVSNEKVANKVKWALYQAKLGKTLYFAGTMSGNYLATTEDVNAAVDMFEETVTGGKRFYFMANNVKKYVEIQKSDSYVNPKIVETPTMVYTFNEEANTYVADVNGTLYYLGTYNNYNTFSASKISYITGSNAADVGVKQFVAQFTKIPVAYKFTLEQVKNNKTLYFKGTVSSAGYLETTTDKASAVDVYLEEATNGVRFYFMNGDVKTYIEIFKNASDKIRLRLVTDPTVVYTFNAEANTYVTNIDGTDYYIGTYGTYDTFSASGVSFITGGNAANVGVSQFVAYFKEEE